MSRGSCGWIDLPKSRTRCWFAVIPKRDSELKNYITIMDDFAVALHEAGRSVPCLMLWEPCHFTTQDPNSTIPPDTTYHITALASANMHAGRFNAFATHIYVVGDIPEATYDSFSSTYTMIRRGNRERRVVQLAKKLTL